MAAKTEPAEIKGKSAAKENAVIKRDKSSAEHLFRFSHVERDSADDEEKTIQVCFSSEELVLRKATAYDEELGIATKGSKYWELLSHRSGDADFSELDDGAGTVLDEHDDSLQLGKVPKAKRSKDGVGRAVLKFDGLSELSTTRYEQMKRGERTGISTGYWHTAFIEDEGEKDGYPIKRVAWAPDEISSVRNAADKTRAGVRRSAEGEWACLDCGGMFARAKLNENFECGCETELRAKREALKTRKARKPDDFKFKLTRDKEDEVSFNDLRAMVSMVADSDKRFKAKRENGDIFSAFWVDDIIYDPDEDSWCAVIYNWVEATYWEVEFELDGDGVTLGEAVQVVPVTEYQPVSESSTRSASHRRVDSGKLSRAAEAAQKILPITIMPKTAAELAAENPEAIATLRAETERTTRAAVKIEFDGEQKKNSEKITKRNAEIKARADQMVKDHGRNWAGKPGEVVVVADAIRRFEIEAYAAGADMADSEVRMDFTRKADEVIRGSRPPKNQEEAAMLPDELASRCSFRAIYNAAARAQERGERTAAFMVKEGAEAEADKELRNAAREFPGGMAVSMEGVQLPVNMPGYRLRHSSREQRRLKRDALAGDFPTAGALIAPEYKFPTIELLRNKMALGRADITILGGVIGNLVLPRQTAPTQSQSVAEGVALGAFDQVFDQIRMSPHRIGSMQKYSRLALLQTTEDFEALVVNDHMAVNALRADYLGINGAGANDEPLGILNQIGIGVTTFSGSASSAYKNIIALETAIRKANIDEEPTYITTSTARGTLRITPATLTGSTVVSGETNALWVGDELVGRPAVDSQQIPNDVLIALVGRHLVMAQWGGWQVVLDTLTLADQDKIKLSMNTYIDYALRHPQAVARSADSLASLT